jgi:hypothetical protein
MLSTSEVSRMRGFEELRDEWRRDLRAKVAWALLAKLLALTLLWFLFFRGNHP